MLGKRVRKFAEDVPGESKVIFTSRVPLGSDLSVTVGNFSAIAVRTIFTEVDIYLFYYVYQRIEFG